MRDPCGDGNALSCLYQCWYPGLLFYYLSTYRGTILLSIGENSIKHTLCITPYNFMWFYNYLKPNFLKINLILEANRNGKKNESINKYFVNSFYYKLFFMNPSESSQIETFSSSQRSRLSWRWNQSGSITVQLNKLHILSTPPSFAKVS